MNTRPFLAALLLLACLVQVGLVNYWIMRLEVALSRTSRVEISNNTNTRLLPEIPAIIPSQQQALPTCESLMKSPNSPVSDGAFLTRETTPNIWTLRADGSRELTLPLTCRLKRYTSSEARQCLSNKHLAFIGDSLTRYQYLSLAYFLERGQYPLDSVARLIVRTLTKKESPRVRPLMNRMCATRETGSLLDRRIRGKIIILPWEEARMEESSMADSNVPVPDAPSTRAT
jgi:hypothetical protein